MREIKFLKKIKLIMMMALFVITAGIMYSTSTVYGAVGGCSGCTCSGTWVTSCAVGQTCYYTTKSEHKNIKDNGITYRVYVKAFAKGCPGHSWRTDVAPTPIDVEPPTCEGQGVKAYKQKCQIYWI